MCSYLFPAALDGLVAILLVEFSRVEVGEVGIEAAVKSRSAASRIESQGTNEGRRVISVGAQNVRGKGQILSQWHREIQHLVELRVCAGKIVACETGVAGLERKHG